jgi:hypothetical protein
LLLLWSQLPQARCKRDSDLQTRAYPASTRTLPSTPRKLESETPCGKYDKPTAREEIKPLLKLNLLKAQPLQQARDRRSRILLRRPQNTIGQSSRVELPLRFLPHLRFQIRIGRHQQPRVLKTCAAGRCKRTSLPFTLTSPAFRLEKSIPATTSPCTIINSRSPARKSGKIEFSFAPVTILSIV